MAIYNESVSDLINTFFLDNTRGWVTAPGDAADEVLLSEAVEASTQTDTLALVDVAAGARVWVAVVIDAVALSEVATGLGDEDVLLLLDAAEARRVRGQSAADMLTFGDVSRGGDADDTAADDLMILQDSAGVVGPVMEVATDVLVLVGASVALGGWQAVEAASGPTWRAI